MNTVLVTGATGTVGRAVLKSLRERGTRAIAAVRSPEKAPWPGVDPSWVRRFDFDQPSTFGTALEGVDRVFLVGPPLDPGLDQKLAPFVEAMAERGIRRVVYLSALGMDTLTGLMGFHQRMEARLQAGFAWTFLRPTFFSSNFANYFGADLARGVITLPAGAGQAGWIDPEDIGRVAAVTLTEPGHVGRIHELTGPELFSFDQIAALLSDHLGRPIRYEAITSQQFHSLLVQAGLPAVLAEYLTEVYGLIAKGSVAKLTRTVEQVTGRPPRPLEESLRLTLHR